MSVGILPRKRITQHPRPDSGLPFPASPCCIAGGGSFLGSEFPVPSAAVPAMAGQAEFRVNWFRVNWFRDCHPETVTLSGVEGL